MGKADNMSEHIGNVNKGGNSGKESKVKARNQKH